MKRKKIARLLTLGSIRRETRAVDLVPPAEIINPVLGFGA